MTNEYKFDAARWLRNIAEVQSHRTGVGAAMTRENMLKCAEDVMAIRAHVARLEGALKEIAAMSDDDRGNSWELAEAARRALEEK